MVFFTRSLAVLYIVLELLAAHEYSPRLTSTDSHHFELELECAGRRGLSVNPRWT